MSQLNRRQALKLFAALGAAGVAGPALAACGSGGSDDSGDRSPVKIGMLVPQSGAYKTIGDEQTYGFELYVRLNGNKLGGRPVQLVYADEGESAGSGKAALAKLLKQDQVQVLCGVANSLVMEAIKDDVEAAQTPLLGSNASPTTLGGVRYIWRTSYVNDEPGQALGKYVAERVGRGSVFLAAADYAAGHDIVGGFLKTFKPAGGKVAGEPMYTPFPDGNDFGPVFSRVRASGASAVFCFYGGTQALEFVKQYHDAGLKQPIYAPGFLTEGSILKQEGDAAKGILTAMNYSPDLDNQANRRFVA
ncbi:MAG TPA: ABC transporter substrate-binding protein, partial [Micromonosporaceae bacterium]